MSPRRTYTAALQIILAVAFPAALIIPAVTWEAPLDSTHLEEGERYDSRSSLPVNVPAWTDALAAQFPGCVANGGSLADYVVVVDQGAEAHRMSLDAAYAATQDAEPANDVWIVGACV